MYRAAMRSIFSELLRQDRLLVVDALELPEIKTKHMIVQLQTLGLADQHRVLLVTENVDLNLFLSARNLRGVAISDVVSLDPVSYTHLDVYKRQAHPVLQRLPAAILLPHHRCDRVGGSAGRG